MRCDGCVQAESRPNTRWQREFVLARITAKKCNFVKIYHPYGMDTGPVGPHPAAAVIKYNEQRTERICEVREGGGAGS